MDGGFHGFAPFAAGYGFLPVFLGLKAKAVGQLQNQAMEFQGVCTLKSLTDEENELKRYTAEDGRRIAFLKELIRYKRLALEVENE